MGLVSTWLTGIGLGHAVSTFKAAGIVTPSDLADLQVDHYGALGVTEAADRKKLFYLVQRIKMAVDESKSGNGSTTKSRSTSDKRDAAARRGDEGDLVDDDVVVDDDDDAGTDGGEDAFQSDEKQEEEEEEESDFDEEYFDDDRNEQISANPSNGAQRNRKHTSYHEKTTATSSDVADDRSLSPASSQSSSPAHSELANGSFAPPGRCLRTAPASTTRPTSRRHHHAQRTRSCSSDRRRRAPPPPPPTDPYPEDTSNVDDSVGDENYQDNVISGYTRRRPPSTSKNKHSKTRPSNRRVDDASDDTDKQPHHFSNKASQLSTTRKTRLNGPLLDSANTHTHQRQTKAIPNNDHNRSHDVHHTLQFPDESEWADADSSTSNQKITKNQPTTRDPGLEAFGFHQNDHHDSPPHLHKHRRTDASSRTTKERKDKKLRDLRKPAYSNQKSDDDSVMSDSQLSLEASSASSSNVKDKRKKRVSAPINTRTTSTSSIQAASRRRQSSADASYRTSRSSYKLKRASYSRTRSDETRHVLSTDFVPEDYDDDADESSVPTPRAISDPPPSFKPSANSSLSTPSAKEHKKSTRKQESRIPNPNAMLSRTGKQLSSIPSERVAPMSPLLAITSSQLEKAVAPGLADDEGSAASSNNSRGRSRKSTGSVSRKSSRSRDRNRQKDDNNPKDYERRSSAPIAKSDTIDQDHDGPSKNHLKSKLMSSNPWLPGTSSSAGDLGPRTGPTESGLPNVLKSGGGRQVVPVDATPRPAVSRGASLGSREVHSATVPSATVPSTATVSSATRRSRLPKPVVSPNQNTRSPSRGRSRSPQVGGRDTRSASSLRSGRVSRSARSSPSPTRAHVARSSPSPAKGRMPRASPSPIRDRMEGESFSMTRARTKRSPSPRGAAPAKSADVPTKPVFVHGMPEDTSWSAQVVRLREDNDFAHGEKYGETLDDHNDDDEVEMRIRVIVRKRPASKKEMARADEADVIHPLDCNDHGKIYVYQPKTRVDLTKEIETLPFAFDNVFDEKANNAHIYEKTVRNLIPGVFEGRWASVFAYGQTGSGKTFTMMGCNLTGMKAGNNHAQHCKEDNLGLYFLAAKDVFAYASTKEYRHLSVGASLFEIYGGKLYDLLNGRKPIKCLENHKGMVCFPGLSEHPVKTASQLMDVIEKGALNRSTGTTSANADSSRSHAVLQLSLRKQMGRKSNVEHGRLTFIDLAGSERGADTSKASRTTRLEGAEINTSLLALKEVIRALATGGSMAHIPFRGSKLTQVLKESFVGKNSRTVMVACIAPNMGNCEHTLNTLRYADRVKERNAETGKLAAGVQSSSIIGKSAPLNPLILAQSNGNCDKDSIPLHDEGATDDIEEDDDWNSVGADCLSDGGENAAFDDDEVDFIDDEEDDASEGGFVDDNDDDSVLLDKLLAPSEEVGSRDQDIDQDMYRNNHRNDDRSGEVDDEIDDEIDLPRLPEHRAVTENLIDLHRSITTRMLSMVKDEMTLVHQRETDDESMDDYLEKLGLMKDEQLTMILALREALAGYFDNHETSNGDAVQMINGETPDDEMDCLSDETFEDLRD